MQKISYMGDGSTTEFSFNFPFFEITNIIVKKNNSPASAFTIIATPSGLNSDIPYIGGKVVFETAPIATDSITISRNLPLSRIVDYQPTEKINPTVLNIDQNYTMEVLKDFYGNFEEIDEKYSEIIDKESTQIVIEKIDTVLQQIENLGDISTLSEDIDNLIETTNNHTNTISTHTSQINTLENKTNAIIDYVVQSQTPSPENNYTWYRKYKSGWVEQGGSVSIAAIGANQTGIKLVTLPVSMAYSVPESYKASLTRTNDPGNTYAVTTRTGTRSSTSFEICYFSTVAVADSLTFDWEIKGVAA